MTRSVPVGEGSAVSVPGISAHVVQLPVRHHANACRLFEYLGATSAGDAVLLESADISTKRGVNSLMVLAGSVRLTCRGQTVTAEALSDSGEVIIGRLCAQLADYASPGATTQRASFEFPVSTAVEERERLTAPSTMLPLKLLQSAPGYTHMDGSLPLLAGGFAFDYLETFEDLPPVAASANTYPDYQFLLAEVVLTIDHRNQTASLLGVAAGAAAGQLDDRLATLKHTIDTAELPVDHPHDSAADTAGTLTVTATVSDADFRQEVQQLKNNITAGDIYQVVPARAFTADCPDAFAAYRALRETNPSPYMFYVRGTDGTEPYELFGASPESNLKYTADDRTLQLYPIAGTVPRGLNADGSINPELDIRQELSLRTDAKELAEHTMLVDLARNDLARVAVPATREVKDLLMVDRYSRVMHLVSRVTAELSPDLDALDAYRACMNMGTLTGAPKLKATELLRGVEKTRRGTYGGAVGYVRGSGDMDTCIVIRSAYVSGGTAIVQAGAGVVRDSQPQREADESLHKAWAVLNALAIAQNRTLEVIR
ncbi:anthranilate synthase component 1 [Corynebacterium mendelii]|uniref:anthranilate synthase n=1 Tax=Corynebacterium mendelii TaxID=2765362 RepID=A0A939E2N2_9CORY|nr:anthranilate synthase component 1 [Corynebacterium mendelii]MBN9644382.1 anthranilate synthase component 1 [Corynebacterium mendelii]